MIMTAKEKVKYAAWKHSTTLHWTRNLEMFWTRKMQIERYITCKLGALIKSALNPSLLDAVLFGSAAF